MIAAPLVSQASAASATAVSCAFTGNSGTLDIPPASQPATTVNPNPNANPDEGQPLYTTNENGAYSFSGSADCTINGTLYTNASIASNGNYQNLVCGTGEAYSTMGNTTITYNGQTAEVSYLIQFQGGVGTLTGDATVNGTTVDVSGTVDITPGNTGGCVTGPVTNFNVAGSVSGGATDED